MSVETLVHDEAADLEVLKNTVDLDSHEMATSSAWGKMFGDYSEMFGKWSAEFFQKFGEANLVQPAFDDDAPITLETVWQDKGPHAPGSFDFERRLEVLDLMGTQRQMVFPSAALSAYAALYAGEYQGSRMFGVEYDAKTIAMLEGVCNEYNAWVLRVSAAHPDKYYPAAMLVAHDIDELMHQARDLLDRGARVLWLPTSSPPAGKSPADHALDPFWALAAERNVPVVLHLGTEFNFRATEKWTEAEAFKPGKVTSSEILFEPFSASTLQMVPSTYLTAMVMGGVFERHPRLRFGVIELGSSWFGPLAEHLDVWAAGPFQKRMSTILSMAPSDYFRRNIRVTPFCFEPVGLYLQRYSQLVDCYCYNTDYPHQEGGRDTKRHFYEQIRPLGSEIVRKFFIENGSWLIPK